MLLFKALDFTEQLRDDTSLPVWINLLQSLSLVRRLASGTPAEQPIKDFILHLTNDQLKRLGLAYKQGEPHDDQLLRSSITATRIACGDPQVLSTALGWYQDITAGKKVHAEHYQPAYQAASKTATAKTFSDLVAAYKKGSPEDTERIARSFGSLPTTELLTKALDFAFSKDVRAQDGWIIILMVWSSPLAESLTWDYLQKHWKLVMERFGHSSHTLGRIISGLKNVTTESTQERAKAFIQSKKLIGTARTLSQGLELAASATRFKKHIVSAYPSVEQAQKPRKR
jgi:aminopeptidase 2